MTLDGAAGRGGGVVRLGPGVYETGGWEPASGTQLVGSGPATVLELVDDGTAGSALIHLLDVEQVSISNLTLRCSGAQGRTSVYGLIRAEVMSGLQLDRLWFGRSPGCGLWTMETADLFADRLVIDGALADGVHLSRATRDADLSRVIARNVGDDAVAINSYMATGQMTHDPCRRISVRSVKAQNVTVGRGVAINGGRDVTVTDVQVDGVDQAAVLVSRVTGQTYDPENVMVDRVTCRDVGRNAPVGGTTQGVYAAYCAGLRVGAVVGAPVVVEDTCTDVVQ